MLIATGEKEHVARADEGLVLRVEKILDDHFLEPVGQFARRELVLEIAVLVPVEITHA